MDRPIDPTALPEEVARFAEAEVAAGRFASIAEVLVAGKKALEERGAIEAERTRLLRVAWDEGMESLRLHGPQLESDEKFETFMDEAETEALQQ